MKRVLTYIIIAAALFAGVIAVSCGGDDGDGEEPAAAETREADEDQETPVAEETEEQEGEETPAAKPTEEEEESGESLEGVPVYPGAKKITSGEWSGSDVPIPMIGAPTNPEDYANVKFGMYESDDPAQEVFDWYKDEMKGWKEEWTFSGDAAEGGAGMGVWTKDDGKTAAWILVGEEEDVTSLIILSGAE